MSKWSVVRGNLGRLSFKLPEPKVSAGDKPPRSRLAVVLVVVLFAHHCFAQAPVIVLQPQSLQLTEGASFSLSTAVTGTEPILYQWYKNGRTLVGQTNRSLVFDNVSPTDTGSYVVSIRNYLRTVASQVARIEVSGLSARLNPLTLLGWNQDVVLENAPLPGNTADFDTFGSLWFAAGWNGHPDGLPSSLRFTSQFNPEVDFQFQPYTTNNVLRLDTSDSGRTGTLALPAPAPYRSLAILAASGTGRGTGTLSLNFVGGTSVSNLSFVALDWYDSSTNLALAGLGRRDSAQPPPGYGVSGTGFGFFETDIDLAALGLDRQVLKSITFSKPANPLVTGIFAVSGDPTKAAELTSIAVSSNGQAQLIFAGFPGLVYRLDGSLDLVEWRPIVSILNTNGTFQFTDEQSTPPAQKFYRVVAP